jgi:hypothetical protein
MVLNFTIYPIETETACLMYQKQTIQLATSYLRQSSSFNIFLLSDFELPLKR